MTCTATPRRFFQRRDADATWPQFRCVCRSGRPCRMFHPSQRWHQGESPRFQHGTQPGKSMVTMVTLWLRSQPILPSASHNPDKKVIGLYRYFMLIIYIDISWYIYIYNYIHIHMGMSSWRLSCWSYCHSLGQRQAKVIEELGKLVAFCTRVLLNPDPTESMVQWLNSKLLIPFFSFGWYFGTCSKAESECYKSTASQTHSCPLLCCTRVSTLQGMPGQTLWMCTALLEDRSNRSLPKSAVKAMSCTMRRSSCQLVQIHKNRIRWL